MSVVSITEWEVHMMGVFWAEEEPGRVLSARRCRISIETYIILVVSIFFSIIPIV